MATNYKEVAVGFKIVTAEDARREAEEARGQATDGATQAKSRSEQARADFRRDIERAKESLG